jgi:hypothetical protein
MRRGGMKREKQREWEEKRSEEKRKKKEEERREEKQTVLSFRIWKQLKVLHFTFAAPSATVRTVSHVRRKQSKPPTFPHNVFCSWNSLVRRKSRGIHEHRVGAEITSVRNKVRYFAYLEYRARQSH